MKNELKRIEARFGPETRFEVSPVARAEYLEMERSVLDQLKRRLVAEAMDGAGDWVGIEEPIHRAAGEAASLAWATRFPLLFFPELFAEKAGHAQYWAARDREIRRVSRRINLVLEEVA